MGDNFFQDSQGGDKNGTFSVSANTDVPIHNKGTAVHDVHVAKSGDTYTMSSAKITAQLAGLASVDTVAGYNVSQRDGIVQRTLDVSSFPTAVFEASSVELPPATASGQAVTVSVPGKLTVHGVTKDVTATIQLRVTGSTAQLAGSIQASMADYGITPPQVPITVVQPAVTIEFSINLTQG